MSYLVVVWGVAILVGAVFVVWSIVAEKRRREALAKAVEEMGLRLARGLDDQDQIVFDTCQLAQQGHARQPSNVIVADSGELRMVLFDYRYKTSNGKNSTTHKQSVVLVCSPSLRIPQFTIVPEGFFNRILAVFGSKDIDFDEDREFSDRFLLQGGDEEAIRHFFNAERRRSFANFAALHVESLGGAFVYYRPRHRWNIDGIKQAMEQAFEIHRVLSDE